MRVKIRAQIRAEGAYDRAQEPCDRSGRTRGECRDDETCRKVQCDSDGLAMHVLLPALLPASKADMTVTERQTVVAPKADLAAYKERHADRDIDTEPKARRTAVQLPEVDGDIGYEDIQYADPHGGQRDDGRDVGTEGYDPNDAVLCQPSRGQGFFDQGIHFLPKQMGTYDYSM